MSWKVAIIGSKGRMGEALIASAQKLGIEVVGAVDQGDDPAPAIEACDAVIDFSFHSVTPQISKIAAANEKPRPSDRRIQSKDNHQNHIHPRQNDVEMLIDRACTP